MKIISDEFKTELYGPLSLSLSPLIYKCSDFISVSVGCVYARKNLKEEDSYLFYMDRKTGIVVMLDNSFVELDTVYSINKKELEEVLNIVGEGVAALHNNDDRFIKTYKEMFDCITGEESKMEKENLVFDGELIEAKDDYHISREEYEEFYCDCLSFSPELRFEINLGWIDGSVEHIYFGNNTLVTGTTKRCSFAVFSYDEEYADGFLEGFKSLGINKVLGIEEFELDHVYLVDYHQLLEIMKRTKRLLNQYYPFKNSEQYQDSMSRLISLFEFTSTWVNK